MPYLLRNPSCLHLSCNNPPPHLPTSTSHVHRDPHSSSKTDLSRQTLPFLTFAARSLSVTSKHPHFSARPQEPQRTPASLSPLTSDIRQAARCRAPSAPAALARIPPRSVLLRVSATARLFPVPGYTYFSCLCLKIADHFQDSAHYALYKASLCPLG